MKVTVLGAGTMGHGIAQVAAMGGHQVSLRDIDESIVEDGLSTIESNLQGGVDRDKLSTTEKAATMDRLTGTTDLGAATEDTQFVIEAVPENLDLKKEILGDVEAHVSGDTIIASNTSSLSVTEIMSTLESPERGIGLHFFNPVHIMKLVEIVHAEQTSAETKEFVKEFVEGIDKVPVEVRDSPGFASSRLGVALGVEAIRMVQEGVASPQDIDTAMELGYNHPMGPIELGDVVGLDVRLDILNYLREELGERFRPPQLLKQKVRAGKVGKKAGEGFYVWEDGEIVGVSDTVGGDR